MIPLHPLFVPIALLLPMMLAACGGGGGGSSPGLAPNSPAYAQILFGSPATIDGTLQNYSLSGSTIAPPSGSGENKIEGTVDGSNGSLTSISITVTFAGNQLFTETFDSFTPKTATESEYGVAYKFQSIDRGAGGVRKMTFFEPQALGLSYSALGIWECDNCSGDPVFAGGYFSMGALTRGSDIPISGTATYQGRLIGTYADGTAVYAVRADASATADFTFTSPSVSLTTSDTVVVQKGTTAQTPRNDLNLTGTLHYIGGTNHLTGDLTTTGNGMTGPASARFYGPQAAELGGTFFVKNASNTEQMVGGFALKKE